MTRQSLRAMLVPFLLAATGWAAEPQDIAFKSTLDGTEQRYVELLPAAFEASKRHDVVIALHGHGSDRWQFIKATRGECQGVRDVAAKHGAIVVAPDYRAKTSWMGPLAEADVVQIIAEVKQRHRVARVFIAGGSMGGTSALIFAALHPEHIDGVCSLNGTANMLEYERFQDDIIASYGGTKAEIPEEYQKRSSELWPERLTMPVAVTTGGKDDVVPPQSVLRLVEKLKQAKRRVLSIHREAGGHSTDYKDTCTAMEFILHEAERAARHRGRRDSTVSGVCCAQGQRPDRRADEAVISQGHGVDIALGRVALSREHLFRAAHVRGHR